MVLPKLYLEKLIEKKKIPHLLLFAGAQQKEDVALKFAADLICAESGEKHRHKIEKNIHPDVHIFHPEGKIGMHTIDKMRLLSKEVRFHPFEAKHKVFILHDAERMLPTSANALLKTFEEPSPYTVILLLTTRADKLLATILSRCQRVNFHANIKRKKTPFCELVLDFLCGKGDFMVSKEIATSLENEKKKWQKEMLLQLPKDLSASQKSLRARS